MYKSKKPSIEIFDSTLREGAQTPFVNFSYRQRCEIIKDLCSVGVHFVEVGYPASSDLEFTEISSLTTIKKRPPISVLGRCDEKDILIGSKTGAEVLDIDLGISPFQLEYLKLPLEKAYEKAKSITEIAKKTGKRVKFAALDFNRTPIKDLVKLYEIVSNAGAEWFTLCDTVGLAAPDLVSSYIKRIHQGVSGCKLSVHFHNDFDMATANTITAALCGVEQLELTINGLGDRAGIAPMAPVVTYLQEIAGFPLKINISKLKSISQKISAMTKIVYSPLEPIIGDYCFTHNPGIHVAGVLNNPSTFEPLDPKRVGQQRKFIIGRYTGKHAIRNELNNNGISIDDDSLVRLTKAVKQQIALLGHNLSFEEIKKLLLDQSQSLPK